MVRLCLNCGRPTSYTILESPEGCFLAETPNGQMFGWVTSICHNDCGLGWIPRPEEEPLATSPPPQQDDKCTSSNQ